MMQGRLKIVIDIDSEDVHKLPDFNKMVSLILDRKEPMTLFPLAEKNGTIILNILVEKKRTISHCLMIKLKVCKVFEIYGKK